MTPSRASWSRVAQCASRSIRRHWLNTTTLRPSVERELTDQLAQLQQLRARQSPKRGVGGPLDPRQVGPDLLEAQLGQAVGDDALRGEQGHQAEELRLRERAPLCAAEDLRDRHVERVVLVHLLRGHLDGNPRVGPRRAAAKHLLPHAPDHAGGQTGPQRIEVSGAADLRCSIHGRGVPRGQAPFRLQRQVVDPLDNRGELVEPVLHRRAGQHEAVRRIQALHGERGPGRPVLDPLGLVEHDDVRRPLANDVEVANKLLVVAQKESAPARLERGAALAGRALDEGGGSVGEELPLAKPLRLERGGHHDEATADAAGVPERVAGGDRLRGLAETHVVGQEQAPAREEPFDAVALIGIERLLEGAQRVVQVLPGARGLDLAREPRALFAAAARAVPARRCRRGARQAIDPRAPAAAATLRELGPSSRRPFCCTQPAPQTAVGHAVHPANARQPVARAGQRTDRIPAQWRLLGSHSRSTSPRRRFDATCSRTATRCLHSPSEFRRKSAHSQLPSSGSIRRSSVRYGRARDPRRRVAYRPNGRTLGRPTI